MSEWKFVALTCLAACVSVAAALGQDGLRQGGEGTYAQSLDDIMKAPGAFQGKEVSFPCRFASPTTSFEAPQTGFTPATHVNFAVWSDRAELWTAEGRRRLCPTLFVDKKNRNLTEALNRLEKYELIVVTGRVAGQEAGVPWFVVGKVEKASHPGAALTEAAVQHMRLGLAAMTDGDGRAAAMRFEKAMAAGLPPEFQPSALECASKAANLAGDLPRARNHLAQAIRSGNDTPALRLALANLCLKLHDPESALEECAAVMARVEYRLPALGMAAEAKAMQGDYVEAFNYLQSAGAKPGVSAREEAILGVHRARIYKLAERFEDAAQLYGELTRAGEPLAGEKWLHLELGSLHENLYLAGGDPVHLDLAYQAYEHGAAPGRAGIETLYRLAELEIRKQKISWRPTVAKAEALVREMRRLVPDYAPAGIIEARIVYARGDADTARRLYDSFVGKIDDDPLALAALAEGYADLGDLEQANRLAGQAAALQPWNERPRAIASGLAIARPKRGEPFPMDEAREFALAPQTIAGPVVFEDQFDRSGAMNALAIPFGAGETAFAADFGTAEYAAVTGDIDMPASFAAARANPATGEITADAPWSGTETAALTPAAPAGMAEELRSSAAPATDTPAYPVTRVRLESPSSSPLPTPPAAPVPEVGADVPQEPLSRIGHPPKLNAWDGEDPNGLIALAAFTPRSPRPVVDDAKQAPGTAAFSFEPDRSPTIVAGYNTDADNFEDMPIRNANLYRKVRDGAKRPAEVTIGEVIRPDRENNSAMAAPQGGTPRAEVLLPASPQGIGMDHELSPLW